MKLTPIPVDHRKFSHSASTKTISAEASDLRVNFSGLYDDACDVGLALHNVKTDSITTWYAVEDVVDGEGDLLYTILYPTDDTMRQYPASIGYKMFIYND